MVNRVYKVDQVAEMLDLHPKTVRRYIRDGKLNAKKIGGQWRIRDLDLNNLMETEERRLSEREKAVNIENISSEDLSSSNRTSKGKDSHRINVSAVVDLYLSDEEDARISNTIIAVLNCKDPDLGEVRFNHLYYPEEGKARYIFWGTPIFISEIMSTFIEITGDD